MNLSEGFKWYLQAFDKYAVFSGRARRKEFWYFLLFNALITLALSICDFILGAVTGVAGLTVLYCLIAVTPLIAVGCRRLHDANLSGWLQLIGLIPLGGIVLLVLMVMNSNADENRYGPVTATSPVFKKLW